MSIYSGGLQINMASAKRIGLAVLAVAVIAVIVYASLLAMEALKPKPLIVWFGGIGGCEENGGNTLNTSKQIFLCAKVTNNTDSALYNVTVSASPTDPSSLHVSPYPETSAQHGVIGSGESREARFLVNPLSEAVPGEYVIDISAKSAAGTYAEQKIKVVLVE